MVRISILNGRRTAGATQASPSPARRASSGRVEDTLALVQNFERSGQGWFWATNASGCLSYLTETLAETLGVDPATVIGSAFSDHFMRCDDGAEISRNLPFIVARRSNFERLMLRR